MTLAWLVQLATTLPLAGLIWTIQLVHYPAFVLVGAPTFGAFHAAHSRRITYLVAPLMLAELAAAVAAVVWRDPTVATWIAWMGLGLVASAWISTGLLSVPLHDRLGRGLDERTARRLVATNWPRTLAWTARSVGLVWLAARR